MGQVERDSTKNKMYRQLTLESYNVMADSQPMQAMNWKKEWMEFSV
jgi:hypothetical protein